MYHDAMCRAIDEVFQEDPARLALAHQYLVKLKDGFFDRDYVDALVQRPEQCRAVDLYDGYYIGEIHAAVALGDIAYGFIEIGQVPTSNRREAENNRRLAMGLAGTPLRAVATASSPHSGSDGDGYVAWDKAVTLQQTTMNGALMQTTLEPACLPLEIGTIASTTTYLHLRRSGVARWPYDQTRLWFFIPRRLLWQ